jgi:small GTP-binding protein
MSAKINDRIQELEHQLSTAKYNKATQHAFGVMKAQLAKLKGTVEKRAGIGKSDSGWFVKKTGDATVVLLGFPSVGKSTLLNALTGAKSKVAAYQFTTLTVVPGVMEYNKAKVQILDVPGIVQGAAAGTGRGKEVLAMVRNSDLVLILIDALNPEHYQAILGEVYETGVRINQRAPDVKIVKKSKGGLDIGSTVKLTKLTYEIIAAVLREFKINNADVMIRTDIDVDQLIDVVEGNRKYIPSITVVSKMDLATPAQIEHIKQTIKPDVFISASQGKNIEKLKETIFQGLRFIRLYLKEVNKKPDLDEPLVLRKGSTLRTVCDTLHRDFVTKFRFAKIWGKSAKFPGQLFRNLEKELQDGDIVEIHLS